ncbi:MAG: RNA polymerase sigma factor [Planctomycetota bacterium]
MDVEHADDAALLERVRHGDLEVYGELVLRSQRDLRLAIAWHVDDPVLIDEVVQDAFVAAYHARHEHDGTRPFYPWLRRIALNRLHEHFRRLARRPHHQDLHLVDVHLADLATQPAPHEAELRALAGCLERLPHQDRDLLRAHYRDGWRLQHLAARIGASASALKARLFRLRRRLRRCILQHLEAS